MRIGIIGTGGVGGYFGGKLANAGHEVTFIARNEHLAAIKANGLQVKSIHGDFRIHPAQASSELSTLKEAELIIVSTKAWQVLDIAKQLKPIINPKCLVLPLQNGVDAFNELSSFLPQANIIKGLCRIFSKIEAPGVIHHMGVEPTIIFGEQDNIKSERILAIHHHFSDAGINNFIPEDIDAEIWKKFLMICSSALLAVTKTTYGEIREIPETRALLQQLFTEIYQVACTNKINLKESIVEKTMQAVDKFPYKATSSLTRDVLNEKPSEINYQNGAIVRMAKQLNVATPLNEFIYYSILPSEHKAREQK